MTGSLRESEPGGRVADFTSALYLGIDHSSRSLRPWSQLTTGKPAALQTAPSAHATADALADVQGCERAILLPSTLHLFFDLFEVLRPDGISLYADAAAYPIALWGAERAAARGVPLRRIPHYDPHAARLAIEHDAGMQMRPVIVADGFCPDCGRPAPLREYLQCVSRYDGYVVLDDTQPLGIWGIDPDPSNPYGSGGGGSLRLHGVRSPHVVLGSSLAKGFGVPLAVLSGSAQLVRQFVRRSETRVHTSQPSNAVLYAAEHALQVNARYGDEIRLRLAQLVMEFRTGIRGTGLRDNGSLFPAQMLELATNEATVRLQRLMQRAGVRTEVVRARTPRHTGPRAKLAFIVNAIHSTHDIARATVALRTIMLSLGA